MIDAQHDFQPIQILIPVLNDWESLEQVLNELGEALRDCEVPIAILVVDDGSDERAEKTLPPGVDNPFHEVRVLRLRRNMGHQRAIAVGLSYLESSDHCQAVVVMDGDGEDRPADVPRLIKACQNAGFQSIVFAERSKRSESLAFRTGYWLFQRLHRILTGRPIRVGNFSIVPFQCLQSLVTVSELWNHYPAAVEKSRQPKLMIPTARGRRIAGRSRLNLELLVLHGLSAISVHADVIGIRALIVSLILLVVTVIAGGVVISIRLLTELAIPGWATAAGGLLVVLFIQLLTLAAIFSFITLSNRQGTTVVPRRDYETFILSVAPLVAGRDASSAGFTLALDFDQKTELP